MKKHGQSTKKSSGRTEHTASSACTFTQQSSGPCCEQMQVCRATECTVSTPARATWVLTTLWVAVVAAGKLQSTIAISSPWPADLQHSEIGIVPQHSDIGTVCRRCRTKYRRSPQRMEQIGRQHRIQAFEQPKPRGRRMEAASTEGGTESGRCEHALVVNTDVLDVHGCIRSALRTDSHRKGTGIPRQLPSCEPCDQ